MKKLITIRLDTELLDWAKKEAKLTKRSLTQLLTDSLLREFDKWKKLQKLN